MNAVNINMTVVASNIAGHPVTPVCEPVNVTSDLRLYRFHDDNLHILVDGAGGFKAIFCPHTAYEEVIREGLLSDIPDSIGTAETSDPAVPVRIPGRPDEWVNWNISQNLTDRWGDLNYAFSENKPLEPLEQDEALLARLREQMWDEITFVVRKDGQYGILFEVEYCSIESEASNPGDDRSEYKPHAEMIRIINDATLEKLVPNFPGVEFAIPEEDQIVNNRPALWAYVANGLLDETQREALGQAMLEL